MKSQATRLTIALLALALAACGMADRSPLVSRVARAASRSIVDAVTEAADETAPAAWNEIRAEPLRVDAAARLGLEIAADIQPGVEGASSICASMSVVGSLIATTVFGDAPHPCRGRSSRIARAHATGAPTEMVAEGMPVAVRQAAPSRI